MHATGSLNTPYASLYKLAQYHSVCFQIPFIFLFLFFAVYRHAYLLGDGTVILLQALSIVPNPDEDVSVDASGYVDEDGNCQYHIDKEDDAQRQLQTQL